MIMFGLYQKEMFVMNKIWVLIIVLLSFMNAVYANDICISEDEKEPVIVFGFFNDVLTTI